MGRVLVTGGVGRIGCESRIGLHDGIAQTVEWLLAQEGVSAP